MKKPLLVVIAGRPGSGKTTLAHSLARKIGCPAICRDEIKEGFVNTMKSDHESLALPARVCLADSEMPTYQAS
jgi:adenylate kinase family enzyme